MLAPRLLKENFQSGYVCQIFDTKTLMINNSFKTTTSKTLKIFFGVSHNLGLERRGRRRRTVNIYCHLRVHSRNPNYDIHAFEMHSQTKMINNNLKIKVLQSRHNTSHNLIIYFVLILTWIIEQRLFKLVVILHTVTVS